MISHQILSIGLVSLPFAKVALTALATLGTGIIGMTMGIPDDADENDEPEGAEEDDDDEDSAEPDEADAGEAAADGAEPEPETETPAGDAAPVADAAAAPETATAAPGAGPPPLPAAAATTAPGTPAAGAVMPVIPDLAHPAAGAVAAVAAAPAADVAVVAPVAAAPAAAVAGAVPAPAGGEAPPAADPPPAAPADAAAPAPAGGEAPPADGRTPLWKKILTVVGVAIGVLFLMALVAGSVLFIKGLRAGNSSAAGSAPADSAGPVIPAGKDHAAAEAKSLCPAGYTAYAANDDNTCAILGYPANEVRDEVVTSPSPSHLVVCHNPPQWDKTNKMTDISGSDCEICLPSAVKPGEKIPMDIVARQVWGQRPSKIRQADWATLPCGQPRYPKCGVDLVDCTPVANPDGTLDGTGCFVLIKYVSPKSK
ncbi:MAG: hypothetical protein PHC53_01520 [Patescibacteria group bacterium]|nr:hypothetical protein [Patescibacteria group bacterium]